MSHGLWVHTGDAVPTEEVYRTDFRGRELKAHKIRIPSGYEGLGPLWHLPNLLDQADVSRRIFARNRCAGEAGS